MKLQLGFTYKDRITGFAGVATGFCTYITGCDRYLITPAATEPSKLPLPEWIDESRLELVGGTPQLDMTPFNTSEVSGGDISAPVK